MTRPLALALLLAGCGPRVTGPAPAPCGADAARADTDASEAASDDAGAFAFVCWSAPDAGVHCFVGADARAACLADPERPGGAPCD